VSRFRDYLTLGLPDFRIQLTGVGYWHSMSIGAGSPDSLTDPCGVRVHLAPDLGATATARQVVEDACLAWALDHVVDIAQLIITELMSNVVRHARTDMEISLSARTGSLRLAVRDGNPVAPELGPRDGTMAETGRGLLVIQALSAEWGTTPDEGGKVVWAILSTRGGDHH
jgi:anti-sigma regulatory factor (Ser/Thr protein kinase)